MHPTAEGPRDPHPAAATEDVPETVRRFLEADATQDVAGLAAVLADDVELISPLTGAFRFHGRHDVSMVYGAAFELLKDVRVHTVTGSGDTWVFVFTAQTSAGLVEEFQLLRLDADGLIREITMAGRPLPGVLAVLGGIGVGLHRRGVLGRAAAISSRALAPLAGLFTLIERHVMPRLAPAPRRTT